MKPSHLHLHVFGAILAAACVQLSYAQTASDNFNAYSAGAFAPAGGAGSWMRFYAGNNLTGSEPSGHSWSISSDYESPFSGTPGGRGFVYTDTSTTTGAATGLFYDLGAGYTQLSLSFDFQIITPGLGLNLIASQTTNRSATSAWLGLSSPLSYSTGPSNPNTDLGTVLTPGIWYHIEAAYTVAGSGGTDYYTVTITPFGGESVVHSALTFRYDANSIRYIQFISTGGNVQTGSFAIDNFSIPAVPVPEPSSTALLVGVFALAFFLCRRR